MATVFSTFLESKDKIYQITLKYTIQMIKFVFFHLWFSFSFYSITFSGDFGNVQYLLNISRH